MSRYTLELSKIENDEYFILFPEKFPFYIDDDNLRKNFVKKFYNEYRFREIGFETVGRFKTSLLSKLYNIMPYYIEYYKTVLVANDMDFMLTKDITETFTREIDGENIVNSTSTSIAKGKSMSYDTPNSIIEDITKYPTMGSDTETDGTSTGEQTGKNKLLEKTTFNSKGNLGVSSDGFLLEKWRDVIVDIDMLILSELEDLFLQFF